MGDLAVSYFFPPIEDNRRKQPKKISGDKKTRLLNRLFREAEGKCHWCSTGTVRNGSHEIYQANNTATLDHIIERAVGGGDTYENCVLACRRCNIQRGGETHFLVTQASLHQSAPNRLFGCSIVNGEGI